MSAPKLCIDCMHFSPSDHETIDYGKCLAPQNNRTKEASRLDGSVSYTARWVYAETHRAKNFVLSLVVRSCGKRGRWFESK